MTIDSQEMVCPTKNDQSYPLVSIVLITYNHASFLSDAIESCLLQDYPNCEIIISDDCSTDCSADIIQDYAGSNTSIIPIISESNSGVTENHNIAANACSGKYIAWMSGDDLMLPGKVSTQVNYMEKNPECNICYHNLEVFDSETGKTLSYFNAVEKHTGTVEKLLCHGTFNGAVSNMVRRAATPENNFNSSLPIASDWLYWIETLENGGTIDYIDQTLGRYRRHANSITAFSSNIAQGEIDHLVTCQIALKKFPQHSTVIIKRYNNLIHQMRHKIDYISAVKLNLLTSFRFKELVKLFIYLIVRKKF
jgi:glycosyltransferase involved in cell wall biosynthesis